MFTVKDLIDNYIFHLEKNNIDDAKFNVYCMAAEILKTTNSKLPFYFRNTASPQFNQELDSMISRRLNNEPLQYILGTWSFLDFDVKVTPEILIPRPETEEVFEAAQKLIKTDIIPVFGDSFVYADIGTGSGVLGIAIARAFPKANGFLSDISDKALDVANYNTKKLVNNLERITIKRTNLLSDYKNKSLNIIISNPPYIKTEEIDSLMPEVKEYEPHIALDGGTNGLSLIQKLIIQAESALISGGLLIFEHGHGQQKEILNMFSKDKWKNITGKKDLCDKERYVYAFLK